MNGQKEQVRQGTSQVKTPSDVLQATPVRRRALTLWPYPGRLHVAGWAMLVGALVGALLGRDLDAALGSKMVFTLILLVTGGLMGGVLGGRPDIPDLPEEEVGEGSGAGRW